MAFLLRPISRSADGREIVRTSTIDDDLLKIGRDPNCDIRLNDLAVALHHATIELVSGDRLGVSAEMGMTIEIDGGTTGFGQHQPARRRRHPDRAVPAAHPADPGRRRRRRDRHRARRGRCRVGKDRRQPFRLGLGDARQAADGLGALALVILAVFLAWPIWSFYQNRSEAARYAAGLSCRSDVAVRQPVAGPCRPRRQLPGLPRPAVRRGARRSLQIAATPPSTTMPIRRG